MKLSTLSLVASFAAAASSQNAPNVLIFGSAGSKEDQEAIELGYNTTIVAEEEWANMTTLDFARYDAVVVPDLNTDYISSLNFLQDSKQVWGPAITGSIIVIGGDPVNHFGTGGAEILISNGIRFAATGNQSQGTTGLYLALSRCYDAVDNATVESLSYFGNFTVRGNLDCYNKAHLVASSPALDSLNDTALSNWGCSVHEAFSSFPTTGLRGFQALAIADGVLGEGSQTFGDGSVGLPYIISHGATPAACGDGHWDELYGEECDDGNTVDGDGCSSSCKCESSIPNGDGTCFNPPTSSECLPPPPPCSAESYGPHQTPSYGPPPPYGSSNVANTTTASNSYTSPTSYDEYDGYTPYGPPQHNTPPYHTSNTYAMPTGYGHAHHGHGSHAKPGSHFKAAVARADKEPAPIIAEGKGAAIKRRSLTSGVAILGLFVQMILF